MNIAEKRIPQDGRMSQCVDGTTLDLRVSNLPMVYGEKVVIRILATGNMSLRKITDLGPENDFLILIMPPDQTFIYTDRLGKRWVDEMRIGSPHNGWHAFTHFNDEICDYDHCPSWCVFDQTLFEAGPMSTRQGDWFECGNFTTMLPDELRDWEGWSDDNQAEVDKGWIIKADTIEELAAKMKEIDKWMDVGTLKATIDTWNQVCENGEDPEFHRSPATLNPLNNPPFYAYTVYPGSAAQ